MNHYPIYNPTSKRYKHSRLYAEYFPLSLDEKLIDFYDTRVLFEKLGITSLESSSNYRKKLEQITNLIISTLAYKKSERCFIDNSYGYVYNFTNINSDLANIENLRIIIEESDDDVGIAIIPDEYNKILDTGLIKKYELNAYIENESEIILATILLQLQIKFKNKSVLQAIIAHELKHIFDYWINDNLSNKALALNDIRNLLIDEFPPNPYTKGNVIAQHKISDIFELAFLCENCIYFSEQIEKSAFLETFLGDVNNIIDQYNNVPKRSLVKLILNFSEIYKFITNLIITLKIGIDQYSKLMNKISDNDYNKLMFIIKKKQVNNRYSLKKLFTNWLNELEDFIYKADKLIAYHLE